MDIYQALEKNEIPYEKYDHPPVMNMAESAAHCGHIPGAASVNLFAYGKKTRQNMLIVLAGDKKAPWKELKRMHGEEVTLNRDAEEMLRLLGCTPGSVSLLGLINDTAREVKVLIDRELWKEETLHYHPPGDNSATLVLQREDLEKFIKKLGYEVTLIDA